MSKENGNGISEETPIKGFTVKKLLTVIGAVAGAVIAATIWWVTADAQIRTNTERITQNSTDIKHVGESIQKLDGKIDTLIELVKKDRRRRE
jgi:hypothetical protein